MSTTAVASDRIVCHCVQVTEAEIKSAIVSAAAADVRHVMDRTGAGTGCTACHCAIRELLGRQCPSSSSPTCVTR